MTQKVLLDTDIGSDIDDAVCLAYLLANPACELMGITTVTREAEKRAQIASALCKVAGQDIPIFPGTEQPLLIPQRQRVAQQAARLHKWAHQSNFAKGEAIAFLRETIRRHPGEITLLTIGPLTNIALLFAIDPEIPSLLKGLVMMCGIFTNRVAGSGPLEWNAKLDPHATAIVYRRAVAVHTQRARCRSIGLDVTRQVVMAADEVRRRFAHELLRPVLDFAEVWFQEKQYLTFHDPLAATTIFDEQICRFQKGHVEVELLSQKVSGMTHWSPSADESPSPHEVALEVDAERFFEHYFSFF